MKTHWLFADEKTSEQAKPCQRRKRERNKYTHYI